MVHSLSRCLVPPRTPPLIFFLPHHCVCLLRLVVCVRSITAPRRKQLDEEAEPLPCPPTFQEMARPCSLPTPFSFVAFRTVFWRLICSADRLRVPPPLLRLLFCFLSQLPLTSPLLILKKGCRPVRLLVSIHMRVIIWSLRTVLVWLHREILKAVMIYPSQQHDSRGRFALLLLPPFLLPACLSLPLSTLAR